MMSEDNPQNQGLTPGFNQTPETLNAMLRRATRNSLVLGLAGALAVGLSAGWRNGAMMGIGTVISAASIYEWRKLIEIVNAKLDKKKTPSKAGLVFVFFVLKLTVFAGLIYGSLKSLQGSVLALLAGLALAAATILWEAIKMLRD
jgi:small-conductance mechanosensitive channel